jgi:hypothetical protein
MSGGIKNGQSLVLSRWSVYALGELINREVGIIEVRSRGNNKSEDDSSDASFKGR